MFKYKVLWLVPVYKGVATLLIPLSCNMKTHTVCACACVTGLRAEHFLMAGLNHRPFPA